MHAAKVRAIIVLAMAILCGGAVCGNNLIINGDFNESSDVNVANWRCPAGSSYTLVIDREEKPNGVERSLRVAINNAGQGLGQITQKFPVEPDANYLLEGWVMSNGSEQGSIQIKLYSGKQEIERIRVLSSGAGWERLTKQFKATKADRAEVLLRFKQTSKEIGNELNFADIRVTLVPAETDNS